jgi:hypothetical protein
MAYSNVFPKVSRPALTGMVGVLGFWLSATLLLDFTVMPTMYLSGMMSTANFGAVGYTLFSVFNRLELVCAAIALCAGLWFLRADYSERQKIEVGFSAVMLLAIALGYTFILTPHMGGLAIDLQVIDRLGAANQGLESLQMHSTVDSIPPGMNQMHILYWGLEALKIMALAELLAVAYRHLLGTEN